MHEATTNNVINNDMRKCFFIFSLSYSSEALKSRFELDLLVDKIVSVLWNLASLVLIVVLLINTATFNYNCKYIIFSLFYDRLKKIRDGGQGIQKNSTFAAFLFA